MVAEANKRIHKQVKETAVQACNGLGRISSHKVQDLKHLLGDHTMMEEGMAILRERKKFTLHQVALYHHHTLARELEEALQFVVPMPHRVVAINGCHRNARHQCLQWKLSLLQHQFWWPGMAMWMQKAISGYGRCIQHKGTWIKAPLQAILVTSPFRLTLLALALASCDANAIVNTMIVFSGSRWLKQSVIHLFVVM